jgi:serine/threonine protein kinase
MPLADSFPAQVDALLCEIYCLQDLMTERVMRDGTRVYHRTQFHVVECFPLTVEAALERNDFPSPDIVPFPWAIGIISDIAEALLCLHVHDIVHLDMKLNNVVVDPEGVQVRQVYATGRAASGPAGAGSRMPRAVVIDFGCALKINDSMTLTVSARSAPPALVGNPVHRAPELLASMEMAAAPGRVGATVFDFSKQSVFELGILAYEVPQQCVRRCILTYLQ